MLNQMSQISQKLNSLLLTVLIFHHIIQKQMQNSQSTINIIINIMIKNIYNILNQYSMKEVLM